jgi:hypothetical protein
VQEEEFVMARFFFIYGEKQTMPSNLNARALKVPDVTEFGIKMGKEKDVKGSASWWKKLGFTN